FAGLFDRYLGAVWKDKPADHSIWKRIDSIPDTELWRSHERRKERLITFTRERLKQQLKRRGAPLKALSYADEVLDPEALTIGFARRFATYKRGDLIFRDLERLKKILTDKNCPVQMIIAGKAHPKDVFGKRIIQQIVNFANDAELRNKIIFIEDYDMNTAHYLVQGADIWLNNPIRPQEASGTSGMKAAVNGVLNLSVLDGWWCEGYNGENGWVIGSIENQSGDSAYQDDVDSRSIYEMLEREIIPLYFARNSNGLPRGWINKMKSSMRSLTPAFNTNRMVEEYVRKFYIPSALKHKKMAENNFENAKKSAWRHNNIAENWKNIKIISAEDNMEFEMQKGFKASITVRIYLGNIAPEDVSVQIYIGNIDTNKEITNPVISEMSILSKEGNDYIYNCQPLLNNIGHCAYAIRVLPKYDGEVQYMPEYIIWKGN
ncbi:MAG: alpha-glucan family phosphorylase, partial [Elusimicrobiota bacterium]|nr:alpha-glucan family phosphorylase [Elusimicrobiota bacterium]